MLRHRTNAAGLRPGFTLVELLVAISVIIVLSSLALLVVPGIMEQDRTTDGASLTRQWLMIAKARAARDQAPRGLRFIVDTNKPAAQQLLATEVQYTEAPILIPNRNGGWNNGTPDNHPYVRVHYFLAPNIPAGWPALPPGTTPGTLVTRQVTIGNLNASQEADLGPNSYLSLEGWGLWLRMPPAFNVGLGEDNNTNANGLIRFFIQNTAQSPAGQYDLGTFNKVVAQLDTHMGASEYCDTYLSGAYAYPRPLVGEKTQPLPRDVCVDLASSSPAGTTLSDYDIVFAPNGQILFRGEGQINLWVRDRTKTGGAGGTFQTAGEQQVVALKKSGALGVFPIAWTGNPFQFAQQAASAPSQ